LSEEDVKRIASTKMWIEERIRTLEKEIDALRETLLVIDGFLLQKGFKAAAEIEPKVVEKIKEVPQTEVVAEEVVSLKIKDGRIAATAYLTPKTITVIPASTIKLKTSTPPFTSYLIGKKLSQMVQVDKDQAKGGAMSEEELLSFSVEEEGGFIKKISVKNYRTKIRLKEILNLITWTFEKMLEKS